jgi:hypothetical protein
MPNPAPGVIAKKGQEKKRKEDTAKPDVSTDPFTRPYSLMRRVNGGVTDAHEGGCHLRHKR